MHRKRLLGFVIAFSIGVPITCAAGQDTPVKPESDTKVNKKDRNKAERTADQHTENSSDRQLAASIRRAIVQDKSLSTYGHNVKVIVEGGSVTLKGPVHTEDEKKAIEAKATEIVGSAKIKNDLSVKGSFQEGPLPPVPTPKKPKA